MTIENPPVYLQAGSYTANADRRWIEKFYENRGGVFTTADLAVTEKSGTPDMSVDISTGSAIVPGTENALQASYFVTNHTAAVNLSVSASDATNPRKDLVVARVKDSAYSGALDEWALEVVAGTPAATALFPSVPANSIVLAVVDVAALSTSVVDANITDIRFTSATDGTTTLGNRGFISAHSGRSLVSSAYKPDSPYRGQGIRHIADGLREYYDGTAWVQESGHWASYTPTFTGITAWTGNTRYSLYDQTCKLQFSITAATIGTGFITFTLPSGANAAAGLVGRSGLATAYAEDVTAALSYEGRIRFDTATTISIRVGDTGGGAGLGWHASAPTPFTWAVGDTIDFTLIYEVA